MPCPARKNTIRSFGSTRSLRLALTCSSAASPTSGASRVLVGQHHDFAHGKAAGRRLQVLRNGLGVGYGEMERGDPGVAVLVDAHHDQIQLGQGSGSAWLRSITTSPNAAVGASVPTTTWIRSRLSLGRETFHWQVIASPPATLVLLRVVFGWRRSLHWRRPWRGQFSARGDHDAGLDDGRVPAAPRCRRRAKRW